MTTGNFPPPDDDGDLQTAHATRLFDDTRDTATPESGSDQRFQRFLRKLDDREDTGAVAFPQRAVHFLSHQNMNCVMMGLLVCCAELSDVGVFVFV